MLNSLIEKVRTGLKDNFEHVRTKLNTFRPYNLGGYALNRFVSNKSFRLKSNIAYGLKSRQRLDLYLSSVVGNKPLVIFVHGGSWSHGSKDDYRFLGESLTKAGYDVAVMNYHLAPEHIFPSYVQDLAEVIHYLTQHQQKLEICTQNIALMGHSAGAFNVMSLLYHPKAFEDKTLANVKAVIGIAGPYHFNYLGDELAEHAFDLSVPFTDVMPYYFVRSNNIRHYLLLADKDLLVKDKNSFEMQQKLNAVNNHNEIIRIPRTGHISIMGTAASVFHKFFQTRSVILKALNETFKR